MNNKKSLICFILSIILIAGMCFVAVFGVGAEGKGKAANIIQGLDLKGGVSITFEVKEKEFSAEDFEDTFLKMEKRAYELSDEASVYKEGENRITVEIPGQDNIQAVKEKLGKPGSLQFITDYGDKEKEKVWLEGNDVANAQPVTTQHETTGALQYLVALDFTSEGAKVFEQVTGEFLGKIIYIVYDGEIIC